MRIGHIRHALIEGYGQIALHIAHHHIATRQWRSIVGKQNARIIAQEGRALDKRRLGGRVHALLQRAAGLILYLAGQVVGSFIYHYQALIFTAFQPLPIGSQEFKSPVLSVQVDPPSAEYFTAFAPWVIQCWLSPHGKKQKYDPLNPGITPHVAPASLER